MKKLNVKQLLVLLSLAVILSFSACSDDSVPVFEKDSITLTIGMSEKLVITGTTAESKLTFSSSDEYVAKVTPDGTVTAVGYTYIKSGTGTADITVKNDNNDSKDTIKVNTTMEGQVDIMDLPPLKDQFKDYFMIGNIFNPGSSGDISDGKISNPRLLHHYNVLTAENDMKPQRIASTKGSPNFTTADSMVNAAIASGFKVVGHTLLWHSQNAGWMNSVTEETALEDMKEYITAVVAHFKGRIYSWDVLNEAFPDGNFTNDWKTSIRKENPWFKALGSDFVYEGFLAARLADPDAILYFNDFNLDNQAKAAMVKNMVEAVNAKYATEPNKPAGEAAGRLLIEGIGMQGHYNTGVSASNVRNSLNLFKPLGVKISISELDVLSQSWNDYSSPSTNPDTGGKFQAATLYGECFKIFIEFKDIIERVSFWGVTDDKSWRAKGLPLLFQPDGKAKPAYYKVVGALPPILK